jgi:hypothetical protein
VSTADGGKTYAAMRVHGQTIEWLVKGVSLAQAQAVCEQRALQLQQTITATDVDANGSTVAA